MQPQVQYVDVTAADAGMRLDNFLRKQLKGVPKSRLYRVIRSGEVRINRGRGRPSTRLAAGDRIRLPPLRTRHTGASSEPRRPPDSMIQRAVNAVTEERAEYLLIAKPPDMPVHAGSGFDFGLIECLRAARPEEYLELVHRLDRGTSGALLVARSRPARRALAEALGDPAAHKTYLALVEGIWPEPVTHADWPLDRSAQSGGQARVCVDHVHGKSATSVFRVVEYGADTTLMEVELRTGRKHQIRAHAAHAGHPVAGDHRYGNSRRATAWRRLGLRRPFLHAWRLSLPWGEDGLQARVALPADLTGLLENLAFKYRSD